MKRILFISGAVALAAAAPVAAQKPDNAISIAAKPTTITFSKSTVISGTLTGTGNAGVSVELQGTPAPYDTGYKPVGSAVTTDASGNYSFTVAPQVSTRYRVRASTKSNPTSGEATVLVRLKVGLRVSDKTPARGQRVRFRGSVWPAHDGKTASLQRRTASGWKTIASKALVAATPVNGITRSKYSFARKVRSTGTYRVFVDSADVDHADGRSAKRRLRVH